MNDIEECRQAVATAYLWISRAKSKDPGQMDRIRDIQLKMEEVWAEFQVLFP